MKRPISLFFLFVGTSISFAGPLPTPDKVSPLTVARMSLMQGDILSTITTLNNWFESDSVPRGREQDAANLMLARAYAKNGDLNLSSYHYTRVRAAGRSTSKYAAFWEAKTDFLRGRYAVAIAECRPFVNDEESEFHQSCLLITGESQALLGYTRASRTTYNDYLDGDEDNPRKEEIDLIIAEALLKKAPQKALSEFKRLWLNHRYPTTDARIIDHFEELSYTPTINTELELRLRVASLSRTSRFSEAWDLYQSFIADHPDKLNEAWFRTYHVHIAWRARQYQDYADARMTEYDESPTGQLAWKIYSAYAKDGDWESAAIWARQSLELYGGTGRWAQANDELARAEMFNNNYIEAALEWKKMRGSTAAFYTAFCYYMADEFELSIQTFDENILNSGEWTIPSYYWRSKAFRATAQIDKAEIDEAVVLSEDKQGWYKLLLSQALGEKDQKDGMTIHKGTWSSQIPIKAPHSSVPSHRLTRPEWNFANKGPNLKPRSSYSWHSEHAQVSELRTPSQLLVNHPYIGQIPDSYSTVIWGTDKEISRYFRKLAQRYMTEAPDLNTIYDLRMGGHFPEAARLLSGFYEEWQKGRREQLSPDENQKYKRIDFNANDWRAMFVFVRGHHYGYRYHTKLFTEDLANQTAINKLEYPIVRAPEIWDYAQTYDIDPLLMHGLLRTESAYQEFVVSWAGAIGYIQVMPQTGAKVAYMLDESRYSASDLYQPSINLKYGMFYFSKLMDRFDDSFPLAIGSYNGGPHNMSRWYTPLKGRVDLDEFVEHISYNETRIYVKKVVGSYAEYVLRYEDEDSYVYLPPLPDKNDPSVINF